MVEELYVRLRGFGGDTPIKREFFKALGIGRKSPIVTRTPKPPADTAIVELFGVELKHFSEEPEPSEAFWAQVEAGFVEATRLLRELPREGFEKWRSSGGDCNVFIGGWLSDEQFDLDIPAEFLLVCGELGLSIQICTND